MEFVILAADDEIELLHALELFLAKDNIKMIKAQDGLEALMLFRAHEVHLLLLDIMMPKMDGFTVLREIRKTSHVPAIMVTARTEDYDKILGLELGADDYITKPFNPLEVVARVKAHLRRNYEYDPGEKEGAQAEDGVLSLHNLELHIDEGTVLKSGRPLSLTSTELKILYNFMRQPGRIFTKQLLYEAVWEDDYLENDGVVHVHISNLRNKIEDDPKRPEIIKTIKGLGYKMEREEPDENL